MQQLWEGKPPAPGAGGAAGTGARLGDQWPREHSSPLAGPGPPPAPWCCLQAVPLPFPTPRCAPGGAEEGRGRVNLGSQPCHRLVSQGEPGWPWLRSPPAPRPPALPLPASWCAEQEGPQNGTVPARTCPQLPRAPADPARWGSLRCPQGCGDGLSPPAGFSWLRGADAGSAGAHAWRLS